MLSSFMKKHAHTLLVAIDDSDASLKAVSYVGSMMGGRMDVTIYLWHMLSPLPPELLEFGGTENPVEELSKETEIHGRQEIWVRDQRRKAEPLFEQARKTLARAGLPAASIHCNHGACAHAQETVPGILDAAKANHCDTIVVGRHAFHGWHKLFGHHVSDQLASRCRDLTLWVVE